MWTNYLILQKDFLFGLTNMSILCPVFWFGRKENSELHSIQEQDGSQVKVILSAKTIHMMSDEEIVKAMRWFAEKEPELTAIAKCAESNFNEQFCSEQELELVIQSNLTPVDALKQAQDELAWRKGALRPQIASPIPEKKEKPKKEGFVYLLHAADVISPTTGERDVYKIGYTTRSVNERFQDLAVSLPYKLKVICAIKSDEADMLEYELHNRFAAQRLPDERAKGDWFALRDEDVKYLKGLASD